MNKNNKNNEIKKQPQKIESTNKNLQANLEGQLPKKFASINKPKVIYVFQGGGALGSYQVGAYTALTEHGYAPDILVGISIGAINSAIIAGNHPQNRAKRLKEFWDKVATILHFPAINVPEYTKMYNWISSQISLFTGQAGFFTPKLIPPQFMTGLNPNSISYYDVAPLKKTLNNLIDFDFLNEKHVRLALGSVDLESGEFIFFDNFKQQITVEHIIASAALPPAFPPVEIDGRYYIDGGVFSNTPLLEVMEILIRNNTTIHNALCFMVDLFSVQGALPQSLNELMGRVKDIHYSSHIKRSIAYYNKALELSETIKFLTKQLPTEQQLDPKIKNVTKLGNIPKINIVQLTYHSKKNTDLESKDYEFSLETLNDRRHMGYLNTKLMIKEHEEDWVKKHNAGLTIYTNETKHKI